MKHFPPRPKRESIRTNICYEEPSEENPFIPEKTLFHGYDADALIGKYSWSEMLFLLLKGELPTKNEHTLLNLIMSAAINPGPRDAAVRAGMNCGVGKTPVATILTTGLTVRGGMYEGSLHVETAMRFLNGEFLPGGTKNQANGDLCQTMISGYQTYYNEDPERDIVPLPKFTPGYGLHYANPDPRAIRLMEKIEALNLEKLNFLHLSKEIEKILQSNQKIFLTLVGVFAAVCCDMELSPEQGNGLFLIAGSAGILSHGVEQVPRKWTEYPFWSDSAYLDFPENKKLTAQSNQ